MIIRFLIRKIGKIIRTENTHGDRCDALGVNRMGLPIFQSVPRRVSYIRSMTAATLPTS